MPFTYQEAGELENTHDIINSRDERIAQAAKTLADIGAIDPSVVRGYLFVMIKDERADGTVECVTYNGGTGADKELMLEAMADTLAKQQAERIRLGLTRPNDDDGDEGKGWAQ